MMSKVGFHKFSYSVELAYPGPGETPIEVEIDGTCDIHCDNSDDGVYARNIQTHVVSRPLTKEANKILNSDLVALESFCDAPENTPPPPDGTRVKDHANQTWTVVASGRDWSSTERYVVIERYTLSLSCISHGPERRIVPMKIFFDDIELDGKLLPCFEVLEDPCPQKTT